MKRFASFSLSLALAACSSGGIPSDASQAEIDMAEMMGITVEELRNQTPQEHMEMMQHMMQVQPTSDAPLSDIKATYDALPSHAQALYYKQSDALTKPVAARLVELDTKTIGCFGPQQVLAMSTEDGNLGGQCCGALTDIVAYELQMKAIERFKADYDASDIIPADPYDISVEVAQRLTQFDTLQLTDEQQATYDEAIAQSHHGGPCCCKCWKWYVMSGLAKKLIVDEGWNARQIAELWDVSSSCGHSGDTDMHRHYSA